MLEKIAQSRIKIIIVNVNISTCGRKTLELSPLNKPQKLVEKAE